MKIRNGIIVLLAVFLAGCFSNIFGQGCAAIYPKKIEINQTGGMDTIDYSAEELNNGIQMQCGVTYYVGADIFLPGGGTTEYTVESIPYEPPFPFNSGTSYAASLCSSDDTWGQIINLNYTTTDPNAPPFTFDFYGVTHPFAVIGANGLISFDYTNPQCVTNDPTQGCTSCSYTQETLGPIPNPSRYKNCIMAPYYDIIFSSQGEIYFQIIDEYPCRKLVLSYYQVPMFSCTSEIATHMCVLYETSNVIEFYLQNKPICTQWQQGKATLGIHNADGTQATTVPGYSNSVWEAQNEAWRIKPVGELEYTMNWYKRSATDYSQPLEQILPDAQGRIVVDATAETGPMKYFVMAEVYRNDGNIFYIEDSTAAYLPVDLPGVVISHNGKIGWQDTVCRGGEINFELSGGGDNGKYHQTAPTEMSDIGSTFTRTNDPNADSVVYVFKVENYDEYGVLVCTRYDSCVVYNQSFNVNIGEDLVICRNDEIELTDLLKESEGTSTWSTGYTGDTLRYAPQQTEQIILTKTDALGCQAMDTMTVTVNDAPDVTISGIMSICKGTSTTLTANSSIGGCQFEWNTGETTQSITVTPEDDSTYKVSVKLPPAMCETIAETTVDVQEIPNVQASEDKLICEEETAQISVTGDASRYIWETLDPQVNGSNQINLVVSPKGTTKYTVHAYNEINCHNSDEVMVVVQAKPTPVINLDPGVIDALDPAVILTDASSGNTSREWTISDGTTSTDEQFLHRFELSDTSMRFDIKLVAVSENGCIDSTSTFIRVKRDHYLWAPTGIYLHDTDQRNREFRLWIDNIVEYDLMIFNRYGEMIFRTNNIEQAWDCTYKGETVPQGVYTWIVKYRHNDAPNREESQKGTFMIYN